MSLFELLAVFIVSFIVIKPEDLPIIVKNIKKFYNIFTNSKKEFLAYFEEDPQTIKEDIDQINFYLEKISRLGGEYEGEYSLEKIRNHYKKIVKKSVQKEKLTHTP